MVMPRHHHLFFVIILALSCLPAILSDLSADRAALLRLQAAVGGRTRGWNASSPNPCVWQGVNCSNSTNRVVALRLPGAGLSGQLPENTIGSLTELRTLSLRHNSLSGNIPSDLGNCSNLQYLYLHDNGFSGQIPQGFFQLRNLFRVNFAHNNLSGVISPDFNNLGNLRTLYLESNQFNGPLPELNSLSNLREFNVSFNNLTGSIPSRLKDFSPQSFLGNSLCDGPLNACPDLGRSKSKLSGGAIAGIAVGSSIGFILVLLLILFLWRKFGKGRPSRQNDEPKIPKKLPQNDFRSPRPLIGRDNLYNYGPNKASSGPPSGRVQQGGDTSNGIGNTDIVFVGNRVEKFGLEELLRASAEVLGKGNIGTTYKAYVDMGNEVVVKRVKNVCVSQQEFMERIEQLGALKHENLVPIVGYFYGRDEKLLLFESMPMGSLHSLLHGIRDADRTSLTWVVRIRIALGTASGLEYIHSLGWNISHGNVRSSNILLKQYYDACVSEYCISKLVSPLPTSNLLGYKAPEVVDSRQVSQKADVYSFGVLILELLTGKEPTKALEDEGIDLPKWAKSVVQEKWTIEVFDPELLKHQDASEEQMVQLLHLAISCTSQYPHKRPSMKDVTTRIKEISGISFSE
ncbi:OLC1v1032944C1 [Oldenlandia corymbosa var. corymbosa]|uniref:OLC1v1032944C1 n=1 Tax=Oldenlandia corymbosa var. corymbosa TaxID=529605 RepID=A0AAV1CP04_OLDCO|nr:OLC1v1032944C1 [Oldenlandia corymbosa var. corymbosa]